MTFKGAFWPELRRVGSPLLQTEMSCSAAVCQFFNPAFMLRHPPQDVPTMIVVATEEQWKWQARKWEAEEKFEQATGAVFHEADAEDFPHKH